MSEYNHLVVISGGEVGVTSSPSHGPCQRNISGKQFMMNMNLKFKSLLGSFTRLSAFQSNVLNTITFHSSVIFKLIFFIFKGMKCCFCGLIFCYGLMSMFLYDYVMFLLIL